MVQGEFNPAFKHFLNFKKLVPGTSFLFFLIMASAGVSLADETRYRPSGPFNTRNQMPMYMFYMQMAPEKAETAEKGRLFLNGGYHVANVIVKQHDPWPSWKSYNSLTYDMLIDTEVSRFYADIRYGILDGLEVGINIPYFIYSEGYLDSFIENFEEAFSFVKTPNAREDRPDDKYEIKVVHYGETLIEDSSEPDGLGEITLEAKYKVLKEAEYWPTLSLRAALKLPTASDDSYNLLGSDEIDYGIGILADKKILNRLFMYLNFNLIFIEKPSALDKLDVDNYMLSGLIGWEFFLTERTSILFQALANSSVYEKGVPSMERDGVVLSIGFSHNFNDKVSWQIAMDENTNTAAPDFGLFTSLKIKV